ncbi:Mov34/MPN/PAD-1 family protein [Candidatus Micrarchaeota archaeon]|nr:Mov34/MPN/PAD-1 family protein [Candidatus Micrarchaeota archaeon]MBI5177571.1 Mov34/MPN/PAD-1 family protein [Candidatus Micrarchaeota archaeon]
MKRRLLTAAIDSATLDSCLMAARNTHPDEFIGLLRGEERNGVVGVSGLLLAPFAEFHPDHSSFSEWHLPAGLGAVGTVHSHPNGVLLPSRQDKLLFGRSGPAHLILGPPYARSSAAFFGRDGKPLEFAIEG